MIKGVILDLDGTLYDYESVNKMVLEDLYTYASNLLGISGKEFKHAYLWGRDETKKIISNCASVHNRLLYCQHALELLNINSMKYSYNLYNFYWDKFIDKIELYSGVEEFFQRLKNNGIIISICTDMTAEIQHRKIQKLGVEEYIDFIVSSEEAGQEKPSEVMFDLCLKKMKLNKSDVIMLGDSYKKDVCGALNYGIKAALCDIYNQHNCSDCLVYNNYVDGVIDNICML
mgnify:CR=1 FL=1